MTDPNDLIDEGLTTPEDDGGDAPEPGEGTESEEGTKPNDEPNPGESPLG
ncbi:hypothetical protein [Stutzerimonas stutzeri]|nr:hypothetical protein [Stutzerimonas stutzeri]